LITVVVLLSLGIFAITDFVKFVSPAVFLPPMKMVMSFTLSLGGGVAFALVEDSWWEGSLVLLGTFGLSSIFHAAHKFISAAGDAKRVETLNSRSRR